MIFRCLLPSACGFSATSSSGSSTVDTLDSKNPLSRPLYSLCRAFRMNNTAIVRIMANDNTKANKGLAETVPDERSNKPSFRAFVNKITSQPLLHSMSQPLPQPMYNTRDTYPHSRPSCINMVPHHPEPHTMFVVFASPHPAMNPHEQSVFLCSNSCALITGMT